MKYVIIEWPHTQELMEYPNFNDHACPINDERWLDRYGSMSFFVEENWLKSIENVKNL